MKLALFGFVCLVAGLPAARAQSQSDAELRKEIESLKGEVRALRTDLDQVKATLHDLTTPRNPLSDISGAPSMGDAKARVVIIEFSDYQCPYCVDYFTNTYRRVIADYVKTGKVRYVVRDFPGESIHPNALQAAQAARCAADQGKFWEMHDNLFTNQKNLGSTGITDSATAAGLDAATFRACFDSNKYVEGIRKDENEALQLGAKGTPAFFLGTSDPANPSKVKLSKALIGSQPMSTFQQTIDSLLAQ
jgi:protein-disulfide isomerase